MVRFTKEEGHTGVFFAPPPFCSACRKFHGEFSRIRPVLGRDFLSLVDHEAEPLVTIIRICLDII